MHAKYAVIGNPIAHSRSPELHQAFAKSESIALNYQTILAALDQFEQTVTAFFQQGGQGLNVTVPFKEQAYSLCVHLSDRAKTAKAVNTLWMENGELCGDNTDGIGLVAALKHLDWPLDQAKIAILGAGGATRGVVYPLLQAGVSQLTIANRTLAKAEQLVAEMQPWCAQNQLLKSTSIQALDGDFDLVINATSASLNAESLALNSDLKFDYAYEMAYGKASAFLTRANSCGAKQSDGYSMLVAQAIESFAIWHQKKPKLADFL